MKKIATTIRIGPAAEDVYACASDFRGMTEWRGGVSEVELLTDGPARPSVSC